MWSELLVEWESIEIGVDWMWGGVGSEMEFWGVVRDWIFEI